MKQQLQILHLKKRNEIGKTVALQSVRDILRLSLSTLTARNIVVNGLERNATVPWNVLEQ